MLPSVVAAVATVASGRSRGEGAVLRSHGKREMDSFFHLSNQLYSKIESQETQHELPNYVIMICL